MLLGHGPRQRFGESDGELQLDLRKVAETTVSALFVDRVVDTTTLCTWDEYRRHHEAQFIARVTALVARYGS